MLLVLFAFLVIWLSTDETVINIFYRSRYLMAVPFYVVVTWAVFTRWLPSWPRNGQRAAMAAAVVTAGILVAGYISQFDRQTDYSDMATPETVQALEMLRGQDDNAGVINNSFTLSLWIAALNKVPAPHTWTWPPPSTWVDSDQDVRCILGWVHGCDYTAAADRLAVGYVLVDTRFPHYNERAPGIYKAPLDQWAVTANTDWLTKIFDQGTTIVWKINHD